MDQSGIICQILIDFWFSMSFIDKLCAAFTECFKPSLKLKIFLMHLFCKICKKNKTLEIIKIKDEPITHILVTNKLIILRFEVYQCHYLNNFFYTSVCTFFNIILIWLSVSAKHCFIIMMQNTPVWLFWLFRFSFMFIGITILCNI